MPLNFLNAIPGTPLADQPRLSPLECLKIIAIYRFILPDKELKVAGGREVCLRDLQSWMFFAGASATMIGNYLTTYGRKPQDDHQMVRDLGLKWQAYAGGPPGCDDPQINSASVLRKHQLQVICERERTAASPAAPQHDNGH